MPAGPSGPVPTPGGTVQARPGPRDEGSFLGKRRATETQPLIMGHEFTRHPPLSIRAMSEEALHLRQPAVKHKEPGAPIVIVRVVIVAVAMVPTTGWVLTTATRDASTETGAVTLEPFALKRNSGLPHIMLVLLRRPTRWPAGLGKRILLCGRMLSYRRWTPSRSRTLMKWFFAVSTSPL